MLDGKDLTMLGLALGWAGTALGYARTYGHLSNRVATLESTMRESPIVTLDSCLERRAGCNRENQIKFEHGSNDFIELKKMIADNDRASTNRHIEVLNILRGMK